MQKDLRSVSHRLRVATLLAALVGAAGAAQAVEAPRDGLSPALCGPGDVREPGIQGEVPAGQEPGYNCGVRLVGQLDVAGNVAASGHCAYVRSRAQGGKPDESLIHVVDVSDPANPTLVGSPLPVHNNAETLRVVVTPERAVMVSGTEVFDIGDCLQPRLLGEIKWPDTTIPGVARKNLPHDIRLNRAGTRVYSSFGLWEVDISNLEDPLSWTITDRRCELAAQVPGPGRKYTGNRWRPGAASVTMPPGRHREGPITRWAGARCRRRCCGRRFPIRRT